MVVGKVYEMTRNRLLNRQLKKCGIDSSTVDPEKFESFLKLVESSYEEHEKSLRLLDRSLEIASEEMQEAVEKNREQSWQLIQQSRLASMGEMISMIAHQWRQPLNAISLTVSDLKLKLAMGKFDERAFVEGLEKVVMYVHHLSNTVEDFRSFFKADKKRTATSFKEIVESVRGIIETSMKNRSIRIEYDLDPKERFTSYPNELKQVVLNLVKNAEDVLIERGVENPRIEIVSGSRDGNHFLQVRDNGGGIAPEILERIYEPNFSTKNEKGTGIGLYMCKIIIEDHCGGKLNVENSKEGAVFTIELKASSPSDS